MDSMCKNEIVTVVLPAYLEEENLRILLPRLHAAMAMSCCSCEVLVIDTLEPMDRTETVCIENGACWIPREGGNSYGDAVRTGIKYATGDYTIFMDADGSHSPEFLINLLQYKNDYDVVVASRYVDGGATDNPKLLILMSWIVNICYSVVLNLKCKDVSNSCKLYRTAALKELTLYSNQFEIIEEILFKLAKAKPDLRIKEIPFTFKKRMFGSTKRNLIVFMFCYLITLLKLRFGR